MHKSYNISRKKSIIRLIAGLFLFTALPAFALTSSDPEYARQAPVYKQISLPDAWNFTTGSSKVVVAVLDTGVDINHPDLKNNIWTNDDEIPGNGIDDDYNGFIDDVNGWNFVEKNNDVIGTVGVTFFGSEAVSHGTVIAGLIGAAGDNNLYGSGMNWQVKIMPIRTIDNYGSGSYDDIAKAIDYAASNGADIISVSFVGYSDEPILYEALRRAYSKNIVIVVAAGNNRMSGIGFLNKNVLYPVCYKEYANENWLLGVTAVDKSDRLSSFANFGDCVDITAPGENIYSTARRTGDVNSVDFIGPWTGTSFATPLVAGAAALIKSIQPDWSVQKIISTLLSTADDVDKLNPDIMGQLGYGRLNVGAAVKAAVTERSLTGPFSNICFPAEGRIYCHSLSANRSVEIANLKTGIIVFDSSDRELSAALIKEKGGFVVKTILRAGLTELSRKLETGIDFNLIRVASVKNEKNIYAAGYDKKTKRTKIVSFSRDGGHSLSWWVAGRVDTFDVDNNGNLFLAGVRNGRLVVEKRDLSANKVIMKFDLGGATRADDVAVVDLNDSGNERVAVVARRGNQAYRHILQTGNGSYLTERLPDTSERWYLLAEDYGNDEAIDLLTYNRGGGLFSIISGAGRVLKSVQLPRLK